MRAEGPRAPAHSSRLFVERQGRYHRRPMSRTTSVEHRLARLLDTPFLARVVPQLSPETLHQLIRYRGLDACGELVAAATPAQLTSLLDLDLWRHARRDATSAGSPKRTPESRPSTSRLPEAPRALLEGAPGTGRGIDQPRPFDTRQAGEGQAGCCCGAAIRPRRRRIASSWNEAPGPRNFRRGVSADAGLPTAFDSNSGDRTGMTPVQQMLL